MDTLPVNKPPVDTAPPTHPSSSDDPPARRSIDSPGCRSVGPPVRRSAGSPWRLLLGLFSNLWFGIILAGLLFFYCSIGSAMPAVRQRPALEMTEFEWFHWWPFNVLVVLFTLTMVIVTIRRIPLRWPTFGVWMIHGGIIILTLGSYVYFGTKVEGDAPVFRRRVRIDVPGMKGPATLLAVPGARTHLTATSGEWHFQIQSTNSAWPILSDEHKGETAYAVNVLIEPPVGEPYIRQLLAGYEQYTEDIMPGKGRAIKVIGRKLVDSDVKLVLDYEPQEYFHVMDTWALYARSVGAREWIQRPISGMPRYHDHVASRDQVFVDPAFPIEPRSLDLTVPSVSDADPLAAVPVRVTGYLRYARMERTSRGGGTRLNPVAQVSFVSDGRPGESYELVAFDSRRRTAAGGILEFRWLEDPAMVASLPTNSRPVLHVEVPNTGTSFDLPLTAEHVVGREGAFTDIDGTDLAYRILNVQDHLALGGGRSVSVCMVEIRTSEGRFTRMVADPPEMTRDMPASSADPHAPDARKPEEADPRIHMRYHPASAPIILAGHPEGLYFVHNAESGRRIGRPVETGEVVDVLSGLGVRIDAYLPNAVTEVKPFIVPPPAREARAGATFAMIRLEVDTGHGVQTEWLPFHQYVFPDQQYAYSGRFVYRPTRFRLADGREVEVLFSRQRRRLPAAIALEDFKLDTHIGGYSGSASTIRNYVSRLRFLEGGAWTEPTAIAVNSPTEYGGFWYFQSTWDKPPRDDPTGGINYTGLGVGNRNGVYIQLTGCCIAVIGMMFAFYVKPMIQRRRRERSRARLHQSGEEAIVTESPVPESSQTPAHVGI